MTQNTKARNKHVKMSIFDLYSKLYLTVNYSIAVILVLLVTQIWCMVKGGY